MHALRYNGCDLCIKITLLSHLTQSKARRIAPSSGDRWSSDAKNASQHARIQLLLILRCIFNEIFTGKARVSLASFSAATKSKKGDDIVTEVKDGAEIQRPRFTGVFAAQ